MLNVLLVLLVPVVALLLAQRIAERARRGERAAEPLVAIVGVALAVRAFGYVVANNVQLFSHDIGGDSRTYEVFSEYIGAIWERSGMHYVGTDELPELGRATLPPNLFAFVAYFNGGTAREGCAALTALFAVVAALDIFALCIELGASSKAARWTLIAILFMPGFVLYSADMYKDPLVWMLMIGAFGSTLRLLRRFRWFDVVVGVACLFGLWLIRFYLVFAALLPFAVGLLGLRSKSPVRLTLVTLAFTAAGILVAAYGTALGEIGDQASRTFEVSTSAALREGEARVGSGVTFDDGGLYYNALPQKLAYTLLAPFPWQAGSLGFHVGKIDAAIWAYFLYRAALTARRTWHRDPALVLTFTSFLLPLSVVYAFSLFNVGLILRQRIPIVMVGMLLGALSWPAKPVELAPDDDPEDDEHDAQHASGEPNDLIEVGG